MEQDNERHPAHAAEPPPPHAVVGRVRVVPEEGDAPGPTDDADPAGAGARSREWSLPAILLGVLALLLMIVALVVILGGAFAHDGGDDTSRVPSVLMLVWGVA